MWANTHSKKKPTTTRTDRNSKKKKKNKRFWTKNHSSCLPRIFCSRHKFKLRPLITLPLPDAYTQQHANSLSDDDRRRFYFCASFLLFSLLRCCLCIKRLSSIYCHVSLEHASPFGKRWNEAVVVTTERTRSVASDAKRRCCNKSDAQF